MQRIFVLSFMLAATAPAESVLHETPTFVGVSGVVRVMQTCRPMH